MWNIRERVYYHKMGQTCSLSNSTRESKSIHLQDEDGVGSHGSGSVGKDNARNNHYHPYHHGIKHVWECHFSLIKADTKTA